MDGSLDFARTHVLCYRSGVNGFCRSVSTAQEVGLLVLLDTFGKYQIEQLNPAGGQFDPQQHEAMAMVPMPSAEPNSIIEVLEKGYALNGRLIRPARVVVAKGD